MIFQIILFKRKFQELFLFLTKKRIFLGGGGNPKFKVPKIFPQIGESFVKITKIFVQNYYFFFNTIKKNEFESEQQITSGFMRSNDPHFSIAVQQATQNQKLKSIKSSQPSVTKRTEDMTEEILKEMNMPNFPEPAAEPGARNSGRCVEGRRGTAPQLKKSSQS